jgi:4-hydroxybenzoate polyprenyltransferase
MVYQSTIILLGKNPDPYYLPFVFFATLCSYSFHYFLTFESKIPSERISWTRRNRYVYVILFIAGFVGVCIYGYRLITHWPWLVTAALATFLYSAPKIPHPLFRMLRKIAIGKTIFLAFTWTFVTTILPIEISGKDDGAAPFIAFSVGRFFFIYAICILFDYRDRLDDKEAGIRSLITDLDKKDIRRLYYASLAVFFLTTLLLFSFGMNWLDGIFLLVPGIILCFFYDRALEDFSDFFYYFFLDGMMGMSAILTLLVRI